VRRQRGVALITAVMVVAVTTVIGTAMLTRMNLAIHRSGNLWLNEQAWWYAVGVEGWVGNLLRLDRENSEIDHLGEAWAEPRALLPIEGGFIRGRLLDLQGRFNLNDLAGSDPQRAMQRLQRLVETATEADVVTARGIAQATRDWIDPDIEPTLPNGAEDDYYLGLETPYRAANRPMANPSELRMVRGVTAEIYTALAPHITALPQATALNVNTATVPNLAALSEQIDPEGAQALAQKRLEQPWESVTEFRQEDALAGIDIPADTLSVSTQYFLAAGEVGVERGRVKFFSVLRRPANGPTRVVTHSRDVY